MPFPPSWISNPPTIKETRTKIKANTGDRPYYSVGLQEPAFCEVKSYLPEGWAVTPNENIGGLDLWFCGRKLAWINYQEDDIKAYLWGTWWTGTLQQVTESVVNAIERRLL